MYSYSVILLPLSLVTILDLTTPFATLLSVLFLREKMALFEYLALFICLCGVYLVGLGGENPFINTMDNKI